MTDTVEKLKILLAAYKVSGPISPDQQDYIIKQRKSDLKDLLKKTGGYGSMFWLSVLMYEGLRKFGIQATLVQSKILLGITAALIVTGSSAGVYTSAKYIIEVIKRQPVKVEEKMEKREDEQINLNKKKSENKSSHKNTETKKTVENNKQERDTDENNKQKSDFESDPFGNVPTL